MSSKYIETRRVLGKGAFGKVIEVFSYDTGYTYAKKVCTRRGHYVDNTEFEERIMKILASGDRSHEGYNHLVHLVDSERNYQTGGVDLIMQLYQGTLLELMEAKHVVQSNGDLILHPLPEVVVKDVARQISLAIAYMNTLGWSHCDIKPENILWKRNIFTPSGYHFSLADFGNAVTKMDHFDRIQTQEYMCTENLLGVASVKNCDMPSLACVLYECVTGKYLAKHADTDAHIMAHLDAIGKEGLGMFRPQEIPAILPYYDRVSSRWGHLADDQFPLQQAMARGGYTHGKVLADLIAFMLVPFPEQRISAHDVCKHKLFCLDKPDHESLLLIDPSEEGKGEEEGEEGEEEGEEGEEAEMDEGEEGEEGEMDVDETDLLKKVQLRKRKRSKCKKTQHKKVQKHKVAQKHKVQKK
jgi:serine/threonine protein kinase